MDRGAWQATVYWVARAGYNLAIKRPPMNTLESFKILLHDKYSNILLRRDLTAFVKISFIQEYVGPQTLGKEMASHSSILAWRIPWKELGRLQSMGSHTVGHD